MASYTYKITVQEPARYSPVLKVNYTPKPDVWRPANAASAIYDARKTSAPDGTTITIERCLVGNLDAMWLPYRRYVVDGGVVRRVDR